MMRRAARWVLVAAVFLGAAALVASPAGATPGEEPPVAEGDQEKPKKSVDADAVYYGDPKKWEKPAEVDPDRVYAEIEEYKQILDEKLQPSDPRYAILMSKASKRFLCAVKKAAKAGGYDLVARNGSVKGVDSVPSITSDVIANL